MTFKYWNFTYVTLCCYRTVRTVLNCVLSLSQYQSIKIDRSSIKLSTMYVQVLVASREMSDKLIAHIQSNLLLTT